MVYCSGKSAFYALFCGVAASLSLGLPATAQTMARASAPGIEEDRTGLPEDYLGPASAVAAIVNTDVITTYDLEQHVMLMIISSGGRVNPAALPQLQARALRDLIEQKLKLQEAKKFDLEPDPGEVDEELAAMAQQSGITVKELIEILALDGIDVDLLREQISAGIVWPRLVQGRYGKRVRIRDEEVEDALNRMKEEASSEQYLVSEICIPVPAPDQMQAYYEGSLQLIEQIRRGVPFAVVAQQFSACTSAAAGGDMGWIRAGELPPELDGALRALPAGAVTNPIPSQGAFMILSLRDKREAVQQGERTYTLAYGGVPLEIGRTEARLALDRLPAADACGARALRQDLGPRVGIALIENVRIGDLDERFARMVDGLDRGDMSAVIEADGALHAVYVCELDEGLGIPSRSTMEDRMFQRQLNRIAQQYLRDVERKTMVDVRLRAQPQQQPRG